MAKNAAQSAPGARVIDESARLAIERALGKLEEREAEIIRLRFGLNGEKRQTLEQVGKRIGLGQERVRQIQRKALWRLSHPKRACNLHTIFDRLEPVTEQMLKYYSGGAK